MAMESSVDVVLFRRDDQAVQSIYIQSVSLHWRHNDHDGVSNHQPHGCLLNRLFRRRSKKTSKLRVTGLCVGNSPGPGNSPHKGPVTRKMFPFDDVIMCNKDQSNKIQRLVSTRTTRPHTHTIHNNHHSISTFPDNHLEWMSLSRQC